MEVNHLNKIRKYIAWMEYTKIQYAYDLLAFKSYDPVILLTPTCVQWLHCRATVPVLLEVGQGWVHHGIWNIEPLLIVNNLKITNHGQGPRGAWFLIKSEALCKATCIGSKVTHISVCPFLPQSVSSFKLARSMFTAN